MIKVKDIVVNILDSSLCGKYYEDFDVRIVPEMITDKKIGEVIYIDDDKAIVVKEFGPYAYPNSCLRLATEEEKLMFEEEKYKITLFYKEKDFILPSNLAKELIGRNVEFEKDTIEIGLIRFVRDEWDRLLNDEEETKEVLVNECIEIIKRRIRGGRDLSCFPSVSANVFKSKNESMIDNFKEKLFLNPVSDRGLYAYIESGGYEIPSEYAKEIKKVSAYFCASLARETDLYDFLTIESRYNSNFLHYGKLKVSKRGLDRLIGFNWNNSDTRRLLSALDMSMEDIHHIVKNPQRSFAIDVGPWFTKLEWKEIEENLDLFKQCLQDEWKISERLKKGKYVEPKFAAQVFLFSGSASNLTEDTYCIKNKSELKLKELMQYLETIDEKVELNGMRDTLLRNAFNAPF